MEVHDFGEFEGLVVGASLWIMRCIFGKGIQYTWDILRMIRGRIREGSQEIIRVIKNIELHGVSAA